MIPNLHAFESLIKTRSGLHFDNGMEALLRSALRQRMAKRGLANFYHYYDELCASHSEFDGLISLLTINETYFFREVNVLDHIAEKCVPRLLQGRSGPIRILSAGCSSGEEAYSLAIMLNQKYHDTLADRLEIHGADIDPLILDKARSAIYSSYSFRGVDPVIQNTYFTRTGNTYQLHDKIRGGVTFHRLNIIKEQLQPEFDIILLRNVSIYFDVETRRELHSNLLKMLHPQGVIFFGNAETLANNLGQLRLEQEGDLFYFTHPHEKTSRFVAPITVPRVNIEPLREVVTTLPDVPVSRNQQLSVLVQKAESFMADKRFFEAQACINNALKIDPQNREALLIQGVILLEQCEFGLAVENAQQVLEQDEWSAEAKMLLGMAMMWQHQTQQAIAWFKQVVYQYPCYWPAHYYLAELYRQNELWQPAQRTYRIALQLLNTDASQQGAVKALRLPMDFSGNSFRFLCEYQLAKFAHQCG